MSFDQMSSSQMSSSQMPISQMPISQMYFAQKSFAQMSFDQMSSNQMPISQMSFAQMASTKRRGSQWWPLRNINLVEEQQLQLEVVINSFWEISFRKYIPFLEYGWGWCSDFGPINHWSYIFISINAYVCVRKHTPKYICVCVEREKRKIYTE